MRFTDSCSENSGKIPMGPGSVPGAWIDQQSQRLREMCKQQAPLTPSLSNTNTPYLFLTQTPPISL
jgi:hypothetical protein